MRFKDGLNIQPIRYYNGTFSPLFTHPHPRCTRLPFGVIIQIMAVFGFVMKANRDPVTKSKNAYSISTNVPMRLKL